MSRFQYAYRFSQFAGSTFDAQRLQLLEARDRELEQYISDGDWINVGDANAPAFNSPWVNVTGFVTRFRKGAGRVTIEGYVKSANPSLVFTLPVGFRPSQTVSRPARFTATTGGNGVGSVSIATNGQVVVAYWMAGFSGVATFFEVNAEFGL